MNSTSPLPREIFLSHASADRTFVEELSGVLRQHNLPHWYSQTNIRGAQQWHDEIGRALHRCDWFMIILSPSAVASIWVKRELLFALSKNTYVDRIVPVLRQSCDYEALSWTLPQFQFVDFTASFPDGCRDLLRIWGIGYQC